MSINMALDNLVVASISQGDGEITPFLKWAGGKRWLAQRGVNIFPEKFGKYIEPFLGSGAIFFSLRPSEALLTDINEELINAYKTIKRKRNLLASALAGHAHSHSDEYFYLTRSLRPAGDVDRAARFIYLNRTCWNGLYRVNKKGEFNVPRGTKNRVLLEDDNFSAVSQALNGATIKVSDFESCVDQASEGDLVFLDPPYTVKHNNNGFIKYNDKIFSWEDQLRLSAAVRRASERRARIVMTNASHESIRELYKDFRLEQLPRHSVLSGTAGGRVKTEELLVRNF